ncbi:hypothetical protein TIFTF001_017052 [Ficus carica]|uniref:Uncharacterized protein n=1 Tax=Ficus carica TaxID=3494 RepID=A0AA88ABG8_FICCA|nr:hypothetical protein TIFTF001_017052 [Ficus carica]
MTKKLEELKKRRKRSRKHLRRVLKLFYNLNDSVKGTQPLRTIVIVDKGVKVAMDFLNADKEGKDEEIEDEEEDKEEDEEDEENEDDE